MTKPKVSRSVAVTLIGVAALVLGALVLAEGGLYAIRFVSPRVDYLLSPPWSWSDPVPDSLLGFRGNPYHPEHDRNGYRNERALETADVVTLGDSQVYGTSVPPSATWPTVLGARSGLSVYNMGFWGYSPVESRLQLESALELGPSRLLVAVYFGNDFYDCYLKVRDGAVAAPPGLSGLRRAAFKRERENPMEEEVLQLVPEPDGGSEISDIRRIVSNWSSLYAALRSAKALIRPTPTMDLYSQDFDRAVASLTAEQEGYYSVVHGPEWRTILTAPERARVLNSADPRIRLGFEACVSNLIEIQEAVEGTETSLAVVLLPTKEIVFWPRIQDPARHPGLEESISRETRLREEISDRLRRAGIAIIDPLDALQNALGQPYFEDADGHPNPLGHEVIAGEVLARFFQ